MSALANAPLALQGLVEIFGNPATSWIIIPMLIFSIPILHGLMAPVNNAIKANEREKLRKMYERLALEKLDVIKTAVAMGYQQADLRELDARLEGAIGSEEMKTLLDGKSARRSQGIKVQATIGRDGSAAESKTRTLDIDELISGELEAVRAKRKRERSGDDED